MSKRKHGDLSHTTCDDTSQFRPMSQRLRERLLNDMENTEHESSCVEASSPMSMGRIQGNVESTESRDPELSFHPGGLLGRIKELGDDLAKGKELLKFYVEQFQNAGHHNHKADPTTSTNQSIAGDDVPQTIRSGDWKPGRGSFGISVLGRLHIMSHLSFTFSFTQNEETNRNDVNGFLNRVSEAIGRGEFQPETLIFIPCIQSTSKIRRYDLVEGPKYVQDGSLADRF